VKVTTILDGLAFPEAPRWRDDALWFSDIFGRKVRELDIDSGVVKTEVDVPDDPSGLGWLADGRMIVVAMSERSLLRLEGHEFVRHADLSSHAAWMCNDMIVAADGTAYVGHFGFDVVGGTTPVVPATVLRVTPDGTVTVAADDVTSPNGMALSEDGTTLVVAESRASRLTAFTVRADGTLTERRTFAVIGAVDGHDHAPPDGICLDAAGAVWMAEPASRRVVRVLEGGTITHTVRVEGHAPLACVLGGADRRTLCIASAGVFVRADAIAQRTGRISTVRVDVPGAGRP
jgi:sugar lactone lactonase YvrE